MPCRTLPYLTAPNRAASINVVNEPLAPLPDQTQPHLAQPCQTQPCIVNEPLAPLPRRTTPSQTRPHLAMPL